MRWAACLLLAGAACAQSTFTQRGFFETRTTLYPQTAVNDSGRVVSEALLRWEPAWQPSSNWLFAASLDARTDTHRQVEREPRLDWQDRRLLRPAFSVRRASAAYHRGGLHIELGKQFIRWGKADILNPVDRFAPRDYLSVVDNDFLAVQGARTTYERGANTIDLVATPRFTPSRAPLLNQRWAALPEEAAQLRFVDLGSRLPGRAQFGARFNRNAGPYEFSLVFFDGFHYLPLFEGNLRFPSLEVEFQRVFPSLRLYGGDAAVPLPWFTLKTEAAWFTSRTPTADEYVLYVVQLERTVGEWVFVGGYSGEAVTSRRNPSGFAPDRGLADAFLGRASYTLGPRRSIAFEAAVHQSGDGVWLKSEFTQTFGRNWRALAGFTLIRGDRADFLGQYRRNSHGLFALRYSF
ncbi:MAG: hypothetical protein IPJ98_25245 [Bryobacterales bacterium]|nr:hypothetical protein [Bryobacterales bacterium]